MRNQIQASRLMLWSQAYDQIWQSLEHKPDLHPSVPEDLTLLIPEDVRAEADAVVEILNLLGGVAPRQQIEKSLRKRGYKQPYDVLQRVKPVLSDFIAITRGSDGEVWKLR